MYRLGLIVLLPFAIYLMCYVKCVTEGNKKNEVNAEINEKNISDNPPIKKMVGSDIENQYSLMELYLKAKYPKMYYFSLKNCKIYSPYLTVEMMLEDKEEPLVISFKASEIFQNNVISVDRWIKDIEPTLKEYKEKALEKNKVSFIIPWDNEIKKNDFRTKVISWYESNTMYRVSAGKDGLTFNFQDEMYE